MYGVDQRPTVGPCPGQVAPHHHTATTTARPALQATLVWNVCQANRNLLIDGVIIENVTCIVVKTRTNS